MAFGRYSSVTLTLGIAIAMSQDAFAQTALPDSAAVNRARAITCLAQAISYEAGNETVAGQEAVAQVILNRLRHPAYPKTICGVVYQGSERKTGCQFTFTCDGSLRRPRSAQSMAFATAIAERVLNGGTSAIVGGATHYHANYVSPYWAPSLVKIATIGAHIFYRMPGAPDFPAVANINYARGEAVAMPTTEPSRPASPAASQFSPWGLPTLSITPSGRLKASGE
jgi:spore germination cell wall hydrolase CwlJ-like protein